MLNRFIRRTLKSIGGLSRYKGVEPYLDWWRKTRIFRESIKTPEKRNYKLIADSINLMHPQSYDTTTFSFLKHGWGTSFRGNLASSIRVRTEMRGRGINLSPGSNDKFLDKKFAEQMGVPVPRIFTGPMHFLELPLIANSIIKPEVGMSSSGCFHVNSEGVITSVISGKKFRRLADGVADPLSFKSSQFGRTQNYFIEELISFNGNTAHDFKVYSFYGRPYLILELQRRPWGNKVASGNPTATS